jgi:hypothetical protein
MICALRKIGIKIRQIWNVNVMIVKNGTFLHFAVPKGMSQCRIDRSPNLKLICSYTMASFFLAKTAMEISRYKLPTKKMIKETQTNGPLTKL